MIRFVFRLLSLAALAIACIMGVLDASRSLGARNLVFTPLAESWQQGSPATLAGFKGMVEGLGLPMLWDPVMETILKAPGFVVFAGLALVFLAIGYKRQRRIAGRFAVID